MSSQPSSTRSGGGPAPIFSSSYGYSDSATQRWSRGRASARTSVCTSSTGTYEIQMPGRSSVIAGRQVHGLALAEPAEVPHRPVQHRVRRSPVRVRHRLREEHRVLVGEHAQVGVQVGLVGELHRTEPAPLLEVGRHGEGEPRAERAVRDVGHEVQAERRHPRRARVLDPRVVGASLPAVVRRQDDTAPFDAHRDAVLEHDLDETDAGHVAGGHQARQQVQPAVGRPTAGRVEDAELLQRVARLRRHHDARAGSACTAPWWSWTVTVSPSRRSRGRRR